MSQITHEEIHRLINLNADQALDANTRSILNAHLDGCAECRNYTSELDELEKVLRKMKPGWNLRPTPVHPDQIISRGKNRAFAFANNITMMRTAAIILAIVIVIGAWQFSTSNVALSNAPTAMPIPTPSTFLTSTNDMLQNCNYAPYQVQANDTLDSIASQFSVPKETIMDFNGMKEEKIHSLMQIKIPFCDHTPTVTIKSPTVTITITPQFEPITVTPG